jgi:hypothetical protein
MTELKIKKVESLPVQVEEVRLCLCEVILMADMLDDIEITLPLGEYTTSHIPARWPTRISYAWSPQSSYSTYSSHRSVLVVYFTPLSALVPWCKRPRTLVHMQRICCMFHSGLLGDL